LLSSWQPNRTLANLSHTSPPAQNKAGRFSFAHDAAGRVVAASLPSGLSLFTEYDARDAITRQGDNRGGSVTVQSDASGSPIGYIRPDGRQMRAVRDEAGRVIEETDFDGNVRRLAYNARGALIDYTVRGKHRKFEYDRRGRLNAIVYDEGVTKSVQRDERGQIRGVSYAPSARPGAFNLQAGSFRSLVDGRWAHASVLQDPPFDVGDDPIVTNTWAPYWPGGSPGSGGRHGPLLDGPTDGGTGGGPSSETRQHCIARHMLGCDLVFGACLLAATGVFIGVFAGCTLETLLAGAPVCEVIADVILVLGAGACVLNGISCINNAQDGCPP
jgi:YD repeat-containing protein